MFKQVQSEEEILSKEADLNRQRSEFMNSQILKNRKVGETCKLSLDASMYQNTQNISFLTTIKAAK